MLKKIVTLYIDDTNLRLLVTGGKKVKKCADMPLETGIVKSNVVIDEEKLAESIKHLFKTNKVRTKKVIIGISALHCLSRPATIPQLPSAMIAEAITREAKRVLPMPVEQLYLSWQIISSTSENIQVFLVGIPRRTADSIVSAIRKAGLKPYLMDIKPIALARLLDTTTGIVVDVQHSEFDIVIVADGIPQPIRTVAFPNEAMSKSEKLVLILDEIIRTIQFYKSNNPENSLTPDVPLYISGDTALKDELI